MSKKALLMILDGWGLGDQKKDDVIFNTPTPYWDYLMSTYPHSQLQASGENVGLPDGQMGNSEVGHLNIGAGRVVYQDLVKINRACADNSIMKNPEIVSAFSYAKENGKNIHFMGLTSNGGVHSSLVHLFKLAISQKNTTSTMHLSTASWMAVILTRRVVKALSKNFLHTARNQQERLLLSSAVIMQWTVTSVGNV